MNTIFKNQKDLFTNVYSAWTLTSGGAPAAVICGAREGEYSFYYAYAYAQCFLSLLRYLSDEQLLAPDDDIREKILFIMDRAAQDLDLALGYSHTHVLPSMAGFYIVNDSCIVFSAGEGSVRAEKNNGSNADIVPSFISKLSVPGGRFFSSFFRPNCIKISRFKASELSMLTLYGSWNVNKDELSALPDGELLRLSQISKLGDVMAVRLDGTTRIEKGRRSARAESSRKAGKTSGVSDEDLVRTNYNGGIQGSAYDAFTMKVYSTAITGTRHSRSGMCCQDVCSFTVNGDGSLSAAISDGAGGGKHTEYGAAFSADAFLCASVSDTELPLLEETVLNDVSSRKNHLSTSCPDATLDFYATLAGVRISGSRLQWLHLGDGAIFAHTHSGETLTLSQADNPNDISNITYFTIESDASEHIFSEDIDISDYDMILMATDGVYNAHRDDVTGFIGGIFDAVAAQGTQFSELALARLIDDDAVKRWGDDHSAILIDLRGRA